MDGKQWPSVDVVAVVRMRAYEVDRFVFWVGGMRKTRGASSGGACSELVFLTTVVNNCQRVRKP